MWNRKGTSRDGAAEVLGRLEWFDRPEVPQPVAAAAVAVETPVGAAEPVRELLLPVPPWPTNDVAAPTPAVAAPAASPTRPASPPVRRGASRKRLRAIGAGILALGLSIGFIIGSSTLRSSDAKPQASAQPRAAATARKAVARPHRGAAKHVAAAKPKHGVAKPATKPKQVAKPKVLAKPKPKVLGKPKPKVLAKPKPKVLAKPKPKPSVAPKAHLAPKPKPQAKAPTKAKPAPTIPASLPPFAWSPVAGAAAYDFQLFRGSKLVFSKRTAQPGITVPTTWTSHGKLVHLGPGSYRWYVWAIVGGTRSDRAVVQAKLQIPG